MPAISVIVPIHNRERYLHKCVDSILNQTFEDFELILVDDCSTDSTFQICEDYKSKDNRVRVIKNETNLGSSLARKVGLDNSNGKYISFIDSDDWVEPNFLQEMYSIIVYGYDMIRSDVFKYGPDSNFIHCKFPDFTDEFITNFSNLTRGYVTIFNILATKELYDKIEFPRFGFSEDLVISTQLILKSKMKGNINKAMYHKRYDKSSMFVKNLTWSALQEIINNQYELIRILSKYDSNNLPVYIQYMKKMIVFFVKRYLRECDMMEQL